MCLVAVGSDLVAQPASVNLFIKMRMSVLLCFKCFHCLVVFWIALNSLNRLISQTNTMLQTLHSI